MKYYSQPFTGQDQFVAETLKFKRDGFFLDIGCHHYQDISNTYFLEKELNWKGIGIDNLDVFENGWKENRTNSIFVCADATAIDYQKLLDGFNMPKMIDYLSIDLEPPQLSFIALRKVLETDYTFRVITFETDAYRQLETRDISRELFNSLGYVFVTERNAQDDYYIHSSLV